MSSPALVIALKPQVIRTQQKDKFEVTNGRATWRLTKPFTCKFVGFSEGGLGGWDGNLLVLETGTGTFMDFIAKATKALEEEFKLHIAEIRAGFKFGEEKAVSIILDFGYSGELHLFTDKDRTKCYQVTADSKGVVELEHLIAGKVVKHSTLVNESFNSYFMCEVVIRTVFFTLLSDSKEAVNLEVNVRIGVEKLKTWRRAASESEKQSDLEALKAFQSCCKKRKLK